MSWELTGNAGIDPTTNFLGTTDNNPLIIRTNSQERLRVAEGGNISTDGIIAARTITALDEVVLSTKAGPLIVLNSAGPSIEIGNPDFPGGVLRFPDATGQGSCEIDGSNGFARFNGGIGIGTTKSTQALQVTGQGFFTSSSASPDPGDSSGTGIRIGYQGTDDYGYINANTTGLAAKRLILQQNGGNVGIGTTDAGATLEVRGGSYGITCKGIDVSLHAHHLTTDNAVYLATGDLAGDFYGDVRVSGGVTVGGDVILTGADCAEEFDMAEAVEIEPGTVVVLDQDSMLHQSHQAYDKRVAGVVSGAGDYKPGLILDRRQSQDYRVPVALVGKVYCKVDAQYAPIEVGDLLTTSSTPGHAMKADDPSKAFGSVIGKALRPLEAGQAMIPILIALQ